MGIVVIPTYGSDPATVNAANLDAKVAGLATEFNGNIENANISASAAIANSKLNLASIAQNVTLAGTNTLSGINTISGVTTMSSKIFKLAKGADVASAAGTITLGEDGNYFDITGTAAITSITAKAAGTVVVLQFDSTASLVDGSNLKLAGNFTGAAESQIMLSSDGTNWFEVSRSPSTFTVASQAQMEAASSNVVIVTPLAVNWNPGVAKAWGVFNGAGTPAYLTAGSYNMDSSITDVGDGKYTVSFTTDFSTAVYASAGMAIAISDNAAVVSITQSSTPGAGTLDITVKNDVGTSIDSTRICFVCYGDQ